MQAGKYPNGKGWISQAFLYSKESMGGNFFGAFHEKDSPDQNFLDRMTPISTSFRSTKKALLTKCVREETDNLLFRNLRSMAGISLRRTPWTGISSAAFSEKDSPDQNFFDSMSPTSVSIRSAKKRHSLRSALVRETGLEPASSYEHMNLNHARLPIPPFPQNRWWAGVDSNHRSQ